MLYKRKYFHETTGPFIGLKDVLFLRETVSSYRIKSL
nr:MAG TPA: hypothetical protein [Caudoviricetes sp.]